MSAQVTLLLSSLNPNTFVFFVSNTAFHKSSVHGVHVRGCPHDTPCVCITHMEHQWYSSQHTIQTNADCGHSQGLFSGSNCCPRKQALRMTTVSICLYGVLAAIPLAESIIVQAAACVSCLLHHIRQAWQVWLRFAYVGIVVQSAQRHCKPFCASVQLRSPSTTCKHPVIACFLQGCQQSCSLGDVQINAGVMKFCRSHASLQTKLVRHTHV